MHKILERSNGILDIKLINNELKKLFQSGSSKVLLPNSHKENNELVLINTAGGITCNDKIKINILVEKSELSICTQAAEKIYAGIGDPAKVNININLNNSTLYWLPKELILFDNSKLRRSININLSNNSNLIFCETTIFGRKAMSEKIKNISFSDQWKIFTNSTIKHFEAINIKGSTIDNFKNNYTFDNQSSLSTILIFGKKILPDNTGMISNFHKNKREYLVDLLVTENSPLVGKTIGESNLRSLKGLYLVEIVRPDKVRTAPGPKEIMRAGDYIIFAGETDNIADIVNLDLGLEMPNDLEKLQRKKEVVEVIVPYNSSLSRKKIKDTDFRARFDAAIIAVRRDGEKLYGKIGEMTLQKGDMMLCVAGHDFYKRIAQAKEVTLISNVRQLQDIDGKKSTSLIISTVITILLPALGLLSLFQSLLLLFVFLLLFYRWLRFHYRSRE